MVGPRRKVSDVGIDATDEIVVGVIMIVVLVEVLESEEVYR